MRDDEIYTMKEFFSKNVIIENNHNRPAIDYGQGFAIGAFGSYELYKRSLSTNGQHRLVYMGKDIDIDTMSITNNTTQFFVGDIPKILIKFTNLAGSMMIKALWQDEDDNVVLESYYNIPAAYAKRYDWWNIYLVTFKGPENLQEGFYRVILLSEDSISKIKLSATIEFTVESYPTEDHHIENQTDSAKDQNNTYSQIKH